MNENIHVDVKTSKMPLVSIICPCYNVAEFLSQTLDSVMAQSYDAWECIIVDDGSSDETAQIATEYSSKDNRFKYVYQENKGLAGARNTGVKNSSGKYILPLDGDDLIDGSYISKAVEALENDDELKLVYSLARFFGAKSAIWRLRNYSYSKLLLGNIIFCSCVYRRSDYDRVQGYDENLPVYEDWDFLIRMLYSEGKVFRIPEIMFFYRTRQGSLLNSADSSKRCLEAKRYIFKKNIEIYYEYFAEDPIFMCGISKSKMFRLFKILTWPFRACKRGWEYITLGLKYR